MEHYQEQYTCSVCKRILVVDIKSIGTEHQDILAVTCRDCSTRVMAPGEREELTFKNLDTLVQKETTVIQEKQ